MDWKLDALHKLQQRNKNEISSFESIFECNHKLLAHADELRIKNNEILLDSERMKNGTNFMDSDSIRQLEKKIFSLQEELTSLHRKKAEHVQQLYETNLEVQEKEKIYQKLREENISKDKIIEVQQQDIEELTAKIKELKDSNVLLGDEMAALNLLNSKLEDKVTELEIDRQKIVQSAMAIKAKQIEQLNAQNEEFMCMKKQKRVERALQEAIIDKGHIDETNKFATQSPFYAGVVLPKKEYSSFAAHQQDVNGVEFNCDGTLLATSGSDRKLKLWTVGQKSMTLLTNLEGANGGFNSALFHPEGHTILGCSSDSAIRFWSLSDFRLRSTLTGHTEKVMAAKFTATYSQIISGSYDRTIRLWDITAGKCIKSLLPGSSCTDLVVIEESSIVVTSHFDKNIRVHDTRLGNTVKKIPLPGRITSLATFNDPSSVMCSVRDDTLRCVDVRLEKCVKTYESSHFMIGADYAKMSVSPDYQYLACGTANGKIVIWKASTGEEVKVLEGHNHCVVDCAWSPLGDIFVSSDKGTYVKSWTD